MVFHSLRQSTKHELGQTMGNMHKDCLCDHDAVKCHKVYCVLSELVMKHWESYHNGIAQKARQLFE